jgi:hypothetical protein
LGLAARRINDALVVTVVVLVTGMVVVVAVVLAKVVVVKPVVVDAVKTMVVNVDVAGRLIGMVGPKDKLRSLMQQLGGTSKYGADPSAGILYAN